MEYILPLLAEFLGFEPKFKLFIVPIFIFDTAVRQKYPDHDPNLHHGILINNESMFVKEDPLLIPWSFVHEVLHYVYPRNRGEHFGRYEMKIRFLSFSVFYGIMICLFGKEKAHEFFDLIIKAHGKFKLTIPEYLKKEFPMPD